MNLLLNIIWFIFGGFIASLGWLIVGLIYCITIIGIPFGLQAFKIAGLTAAPFGKRVKRVDSSLGGLLGNIIWIVFGGIELAITHISLAIALGITIIGIPLALQHIKLAGISLVPFGTRIHKI